MKAEIDFKKFYITTPIYYASGAPHIGHAYTTIAADVLARYYRLHLGDENVYFLVGTDEHGLKIAENAEKNNQSPKEFVDKIASDYIDLWKNLNISNSDFIRTTDAKHESFVIDFVNKLKDNGFLYEAEYEGLYCVACESFLQEKDLNEKGECPDHLRKPELVKEKNWFFTLAGNDGGRNFLNEIKGLIESDELEIAPAAMKSEVLGLIKQGIPNFSVSRNKEKVKWGIELPWDEKQLIYVWPDALTNYISALDDKSWWPAQVQLLGKDILKFHTIYWPAMLLAAGYKLPKKLFAHGFFTMNGQKMSKTIGNVIDPKEMVEEFGSDVTKYLLLSSFPFGQDGDIEKDKFAEKYNNFFANHFGNYINRVLTLLHKNYGGKIPDYDDKILENEKGEKFGFLKDEFREKMQKFKEMLAGGNDKVSWGRYDDLFEEFAFDKILNNLIYYVIQIGNELISLEGSELWNHLKDDKYKEINATEIYYLLESIRHLTLMIEPFLPETTERLKDLLNWKPEFNSREWDVLPVGHEIKKPVILFPRLKINKK